MRRAGVRRFVLGTRYSPAHLLVAVVRARAINWTSSEVVGWYPNDFTTRDLYAVFPRRSMLGERCSDLVLYSRVGPAKFEGEDCMRVATEKVQRDSDLATVDKRRR